MTGSVAARRRRRTARASTTRACSRPAARRCWRSRRPPDAGTDPTPKLTNASCSVNLRTKPTTSATRKATIAAGTTVRVIATVTAGGSYSTECGGKDVSGKSWFKIDRVNGKSVSSLYGVSAVYGAAGLFRPASSTTAALPSESIGTVGQTAADSERGGGRHADADTGSFPHPDTRIRPRRRRRTHRRHRRRPRTLADSEPSPSPTPLIAKVYTLTSSVTFYGRGYGHGVGLSQYGARGRAAAGQGFAAILAHYFQGTTLGSVANSQIRVLVLNDFAASSTHPLTIYGRTGTFTIDGIAKTFPKDARVRIYPTTSSGTTWKVVVTSAGGTTLHNGSIAKSFRIRPAQTSTRLQLYSKPSSYDRYRGVFRIVASTKVDVVNELPLESYLRGVVPAEMPSTWHAEALKAQVGRGAVVRRAPPATGRFDVRPLRRHALAGLPGRAARSDEHEQRDHRNRRQGRQERLVDREHVLPLDRRRRHGEQRERLRVVHRGEGRRPRELPPRLVRPGTRRQALRRVVAVHLLEDRDVHALPALDLAGRRQPHERRQRREARPPQPRRFGPADQRDDHRLERHEEEGLRRRVPVGHQRAAAIRRPPLPQQLFRADSGP